MWHDCARSFPSTATNAASPEPQSDVRFRFGCTRQTSLRRGRAPPIALGTLGIRPSSRCGSLSARWPSHNSREAPQPSSPQNDAISLIAQPRCDPVGPHWDNRGSLWPVPRCLSVAPAVLGVAAARFLARDARHMSRKLRAARGSPPPPSDDSEELASAQCGSQGRTYPGRG